MGFLDEQTQSEYWIMRVREEFFVTLYLVTKSQILSLFLSPSLSSRTGTHTYTQSSKPCCQHRPLTVYHRCENSSSVMYEKNTSKNKHENLDVTHTERHHTTLTVFIPAGLPLLSTWLQLNLLPWKCQYTNNGLCGAKVNSRQLARS